MLCSYTFLQQSLTNVKDCNIFLSNSQWPFSFFLKLEKGTRTLQEMLSIKLLTIMPNWCKNKFPENLINKLKDAMYD
jgi:hypothetical protein